MPPTYTYLECVGDNSPSSATASLGDSSTSAPYMMTLDGGTPEDRFRQLQRSIIDVLGFTGTKVGEGAIQRQLPLRHPIWQWMFATNVSYEGIGEFAMVTASPGPGSALINTQVPIYKEYRLQVPMQNRGYNSWQDADISVVDSQFVYKDGTTKNFKYAEEWLRYTEWTENPKFDFITAQQGQMNFRATSGPVNNEPFQDAPKMFLSDSTVSVTWTSVPYRYITSPRSYLSRFVGYINQFAIGPDPASPNAPAKYPAASLLFQGATVTRLYTNPVPDEGLLAFNYGTGFNKARLCDINLNFAYTPRVAGAAPPSAPTNGNWLAAGWNLLYWLTTRRAYYATSFDPTNPSDQSKWVPSYLSFPFELLFTDPDAPQPFGTIEP